MNLLQVVDELYDGPAWHGPSLRESLRGVTAAEAAWRPSPVRHNIWELVVHAAYWKHVVRGRITGRKEPFAFAGHDWFARPRGARTWRDDLRLLAEEHRKLRAVVAAMTPEDRRRRLPRRKDTAGANVFGVAAHDAYHAGQIGLLRKLARENAKTRRKSSNRRTR
jgi:uncharacterized damage-inducible protein DinB